MASQVERIKWVQGTPFIVDGFSFLSPKCEHYFLTHFHSDHYWGLRPSFAAGTIYCSQVTADLLVGKLGVKPQFVRPIALRRPTVIQGVEVTALDANHCPGAVMFLFRVPQEPQPPRSLGRQQPLGRRKRPRPGGDEQASAHAGKPQWEPVSLSPSQSPSQGRTQQQQQQQQQQQDQENRVAGSQQQGQQQYTVILHTGDFRASPALVEATARYLRQERGIPAVDILYLDTTYCNPKYTFPAQEEALAAMARIAREEKAREPETVFYVGTYSIGKERAVRAVAQAIGARVYADERKERVLRLAGEWDDALFSSSVEGCDVRMSWLGRLRPERLRAGKQEQQRQQQRGKEEGDEEEEEEDDENDDDEEEEEVGRGMKNNDEEEEEEEEEEQEAADAGTAEPGTQPGRRPPVVGFRPTGWSFSRNKVGPDGRRTEYRPWVDEAGRSKLFFVPYSEHSSYSELRAFVRAIRPRQIVPTVGVGDPGKVEKILRHFLQDMDLSKDKSRLDSYFTRGGAAGKGKTVTAAAAATASTTTVTTTTTRAVKTVATTTTRTTTSMAASASAGLVDLAAVNVDEQARLWAALTAGKQQQRQQLKEEEEEAAEEAVPRWEPMGEENEQDEEDEDGKAPRPRQQPRRGEVITIEIDSD